jgi:hypothetical protein
MKTQPTTVAAAAAATTFINYRVISEVIFKCCEVFIQN